MLFDSVRIPLARWLHLLLRPVRAYAVVYNASSRGSRVKAVVATSTLWPILNRVSDDGDVTS
jgi:hypothetical protein